MKYTVKPATAEGCDCDDCRAGRHLYELYRLEASGWYLAGISLQTYASAEECKRHHYWGDFGPDDTWEDGTPMVKPEREPGHVEARQSGTAGTRKLNTKALLKSYVALKQHWRP